MTRLCGYISSDGELTGARLRTMIERMRHATPASATIACFEQAGLATLAPSPATRLVRDPARQSCLALAGYLLDCDDLNNLLAAWEQRGPAILEQLDGDFVLAHYHQPSQTLTLAASFFGPVPLYYVQTERGLAFASEAKALVGLLNEAKLDWDAAADFFYLGHMLGNRTLFAGIRALGAAQVLTYRRGHLSSRSYADFTRTPVLAEAEVSTARLAELFERAVERRQGSQPQTVLLSGGMDSRLILGSLRRAGTTPRLITLEHAGFRDGADGRYAQAIARHLGLECELRPANPRYYASPDCLEVFAILDGMVPAWNLWVGQIYQELDPTLGTVWDGLALDVGLGGSHQHATLDQNLAELLAKRAITRPLLRQALTPDAFARLDRRFMERLHSAIDAIPPSQNQYLYFLLQHRTRRRIAPNPYQLFACQAEPRTPGTDRDFLTYALSIPAGMKRDHRLYRQVYQQHFPELTAVPIVSGGALLYFEPNTSVAARERVEALRVTLTRTAQQLQIKRRLKRLLRQPLNARDRQVSEIIADILLPAALDRPWYDTALLRRRWADYRGGNILHHELFTIIFYVELWHRLFLQPDHSLLQAIQQIPLTLNSQLLTLNSTRVEV